MELNSKQLAVVTATEPKILVEAAAASGKTACLVERIRWLLSMGADPKKIVAITFTNNAAAEILDRLGHPEGLFIGTVHSYCNYLLRAGGVATDTLLNEDRFDDLFLLIKENTYCIKEIDYLIVDEAQDSTAQQFEFFELLSPKNFMYFYDLRQSIYGFASADPDYLVNLRHKEEMTLYELNQNYRNGNAILNKAREIINRLGYEYQDHSVPMRHIQGKCITSNMSLEGIGNLMKGQVYGDWFILCRSNKEVDAICAVLNEKGIPNDTFKQADLNTKELKDRMEANTIKVLTVHSAKGLEANRVLVYNPKLYNDEEIRVYYVAATRARDELLWVYPLRKTQKRKQAKTKMTSWE